MSSKPLLFGCLVGLYCFDVPKKPSKLKKKKMGVHASPGPGFFTHGNAH